MKRYQVLLYVMGVFLLFNCNKNQVAQVDFNLKLTSKEAQLAPLRVSIDSARYFTLQIAIEGTEKAATLYPTAQFKLQYRILDREGRPNDSVFLYTTPTNVSSPSALAKNQYRDAGSMPGASIKDYTIYGTSARFKAFPYYKIVFTLMVIDTPNNPPFLTPNMAERTIEVTIDTNNTMKANYKSFSYNNFKEKDLKQEMYVRLNTIGYFDNKKYINIIG